VRSRVRSVSACVAYIVVWVWVEGRRRSCWSVLFELAMGELKFFMVLVDFSVESLLMLSLMG